MEIIKVILYLNGMFHMQKKNLIVVDWLVKYTQQGPDIQTYLHIQ
jgi:hypothetical protein